MAIEIKIADKENGNTQRHEEFLYAKQRILNSPLGKLKDLKAKEESSNHPPNAPIAA